MNEVPSSLHSNQKLALESIATAMFSSPSLEELLKVFLTSLGAHLAVDRVAILKFINQQEGKILVEAISPNFRGIKIKHIRSPILGSIRFQTILAIALPLGQIHLKIWTYMRIGKNPSYSHDVSTNSI